MSFKIILAVFVVLLQHNKYRYNRIPKRRLVWTICMPKKLKTQMRSTLDPITHSRIYLWLKHWCSSKI